MTKRAALHRLRTISKRRPAAVRGAEEKSGEIIEWPIKADDWLQDV